MGLKQVSDIMEDARRQQKAVMCFECVNYEQIAWVIETAEEQKTPVVLMLYYDMDFYSPIPVFLAMAKELAGRAVIDVGLLYDHADTKELVEEALRNGFGSVMFYHGRAGFEENLRLTREVVRMAESWGADVIGYPGEAVSPGQCGRFVMETGVRSVIAPVVLEDIHNRHDFDEGCHWSEENKAVIDFDYLQRLKDQTDVPLVLHGAYNVPDEQIRESIRYGISKIDDGCPFDTACYRAVKSVIDSAACAESLFGCLIRVRERMKPYIRQRLRLAANENRE